MIPSVRSPEVEETLRAAHSSRNVKVSLNGKKKEFRIPFPSPSDWRNVWIYFLMIDRFNNPTAPVASTPWDGEWGGFQGGTLKGAATDWTI